ncbi:DUF1643 domain-containing protein [Burkholderia glumae]|uniref:DUF1643 domain-containing protein n=1 Tax=Burkholderia glumae TaxID=337 RepID=UPI0020372EE6|nr:DUF1643 domain-containing protein [Burkholderia glumae]
MSAIISPCGLYRYRLDRTVPNSIDDQTFAFFGVNPSTADATLDDATVRKWIGFTQRYGGRRFIVGNVFAYRATDVRALNTQQPIGPDNDRYLREIIAEADVLIPCWGSREKVPGHLRQHLDKTMALLVASDKPVLCFGLTLGGDPKHPLMLGYDTRLVPIDMPEMPSAIQGDTR